MYLPLSIYGWEGFEKTILHQIEMGNLLRKLLLENGWNICNDSKLPIVCFSHPELKKRDIKKLAELTTKEGKVWISVYPIHQQDTLRACITSYATTEAHIRELVHVLNISWENVKHSPYLNSSP